MSSTTENQTHLDQYSLDGVLNYIKSNFEIFEEERKLWKEQKEGLNKYIARIEQERNMYKSFLDDIGIICKTSERHSSEVGSPIFCTLPNPLLKHESSDSYRLAEINKVLVKFGSYITELRSQNRPSLDVSTMLYSPASRSSILSKPSILSSQPSIERSLSSPLASRMSSPPLLPSRQSLSQLAASPSSEIPSSISLLQYPRDSRRFSNQTEVPKQIGSQSPSNVNDSTTPNSENPPSKNIQGVPENTSSLNKNDPEASSLFLDDLDQLVDNFDDNLSPAENHDNNNISLNEKILREDEYFSDPSLPHNEQSKPLGSPSQYGSKFNHSRETTIFIPPSKDSIIGSDFLLNTIQNDSTKYPLNSNIPNRHTLLSPVSDSNEIHSDKDDLLSTDTPTLTSSMDNNNNSENSAPISATTPSSNQSTPIEVDIQGEVNEGPSRYSILSSEVNLSTDPKELHIPVNNKNLMNDTFPLFKDMSDERFIAFHHIASTATIRYHVSPIRTISSHSTLPLLISGSDEGVVCLWKIQQVAANMKPCRTFGSHIGSVLTSTFVTLANVAVTAGFDGYLCIWDIPSFDQLDRSPRSNSPLDLLKGRIEAHEDVIWSVASHPSHPFIASCSSDNSVKLWNLNEIDNTINFTPTVLNYVPSSIQSLSSLTPYTPTKLEYSTLYDQILGVGMTTGDLSIIDIEENIVQHTFHPCIYSVCSHPNYPLFITGTKSGTVYMYDIRDSYPVTSFKAHNDSISSCMVPDGFNNIITSSYDNNIRIWDIKQRTCLQEIRQPHESVFEENITDIAYSSSNGIFISSGVDQTLVFYYLN